MESTRFWESGLVIGTVALNQLVAQSSVNGALPELFKIDNVIAANRFDLDAPDLQLQIQTFLDQHICQQSH